MEAVMIADLGPPLFKVHIVRGLVTAKANWKEVLNQFTADTETS